MSKHLSEDEFAKYFAGQSSSVLLQHAAECSACAAELQRFDKTVSVFRNAIRERIDEQVALKRPSVIPPSAVRPAALRSLTWRWAWVAAAVLVFVMVPLLMIPHPPQQVVTETAAPPMSPDALMNAVNMHLSRTVPAPMERMMIVVSNDDSMYQSGGVQ